MEVGSKTRTWNRDAELITTFQMINCSILVIPLRTNKYVAHIPTFAAQNQVLHLVSPILRQTVNPTLCKEVGKNVPTPPKVARNRKTKISANWPKTKTMMVRGDHH